MFRLAPTGIATCKAGLWPALSLLNNRHRQYRYQLLVALVTLMTGDILPVTQREGNEQALLGDQLEDDDMWPRPSSKGPKTLGQSLTTLLEEGMDIRADTAIEGTT